MAFFVGVTTLTFLPTDAAQAVVVQWGTNNGSAPNYQVDVNGDFVMGGNGVLACDAAVATGYGTCAQLHQGTSPATTNPSVNDAFRMVNANTVSGFTTNSSSATVTIPAGATVEKAFLNWSANTGTYAGLSGAYCGAQTFGAATLPAGSATGYRSRAIQFQVGSGAIQSFAPASLLEDATSQATSRYYSATADVTSAFANATTGSALTISAGNIWAVQGPGCYAGWSVTVVYDYGTYVVGNVNSAPHRVIYYEGHVRQGQNDAALTVDYSGFTAVDTGTRAGFTLYEGDRGITGDTASYRRGSDTAFTEIPNSAGATGNIGIGRAAGSVRYTQTSDTSAFTNQSVDVLTQPLSRVVAGDSTVRLQLQTSGDSYLLTNSTLSVPTAGLKVEKTFNGTADNQFRTAGEVATFTIRLTNVGAGTLTNIAVTDDQANCTRTLTGTTLAPQASTSFTCTAAAGTTATYTTTADATARTQTGGYLANGSDSTTVTLSALGLTKTSALAAGASGRAGDVVTYTFTATNTGGGTLTNVAVTDPLSGLSALTYGTWPSGTSGTLQAGQSVTATATRALSQTDVDNGSIANTATVVGTDADGGIRPTASASNTHTVAPAGSITTTKTGTITSGSGGVGSTITWAIRFTNSGNVTLTGVTLADSLPGLSTPVITWPGTSGRLAPGQVATATATSTVTQAQVDAGLVSNTATVQGTQPQGGTVTGASSAANVTTVAASPSLSVVKSAAYTSGSGAVGSVLRYSFQASNTGNVTLTGVAISDPLSGLGALTYAWPGASGTLAPGQTVTATASYTVTQADVDRGSIVNRASVSGTPPSGAAVTAQSAQVTTATQTAAPSLSFTKSGSTSGQTAGSTVTYTFTLGNTGNVTLTGAGITDPLTGLSAITYGTWPSGTTGTLRPGDTVTGTARYTLTQADVDAGAVINTATATAAPPTGANVTQSRSATVPITPTGGLAVTKTGAITSGNGGVGSTITWTLTARNSGNVTLTQVALTDDLPGITAPAYGTWPSGTTGTLRPGDTITATATSTITQAQLDAGTITNTATATGRTPQGTTTTGTSPTATITPATPAPDISVVKTGTVRGGAAGNAGDVIGYTFTVTNTGNVTLTGMTLSDPLDGLSTPSFGGWPGTAGTLTPGQSVTATAAYTIRQSDVNSGSVVNTAIARGNGVRGGAAQGSSTATTPVAAAAPGVVVTKSGALASGATGVAGDTVNWSFTIRNSGNVTLTAVEILERTTGVSARTYSWPGTAGILQPGQTATATATSTLTQTDVDAGSIINTAYGRGTTPQSTTTTSADTAATVALAPRGTLTLTKTASTTTGIRLDDTITYTLTARNTGNVTLTGVTITDPLPGLSPLTYGTWPTATTGTLRPGDQITATATYTARQTDINRGTITNTATTTGTTPQNATATQTTTNTITTVAASPGLAAAKSAAYTTGSGAVGSVVTYTITGRNSGNVTMTGVEITDTLDGLTPLVYQWPGTAGTLQPGEVVTATATYTLTQADVDRGTIANTATLTGTPPDGAAVVARSATVVTPTAASAPDGVFTKTAALTGPSSVGTRIDYTLTYRNSGNVTLTGVALTDPMFPGGVTYGTWPSGTAGTLRVGDTITATASRTLTQSDLDAGSVVNTATATATPPTGAPFTRTASATVPLTPGTGLALAKSSAYTTGTGAVGSVVTYTFRAENTGSVTLTGLSISDPLSGLSALSWGSWPSGTTGTLRPGDAVTATATRTVTQADVDAGSVTNTATASARTPQGTPVPATSNTVTTATADAAPGLQTTKSASVAGGGVVGSVVTYTIRAENTGNTTLRSVVVSDPLFPSSSLDYGTWPSGTPGTLRPGDAVVVTARHTVTQEEFDRGSISNTATTTAQPPSGPALTADSATVVTPLGARSATISLTHTGALPAGSPGRAGDIVTFGYSFTNTGSTTLSGIVLTPGLGMQTGPTITWPGATGTLAPGQTATATSTYTLTQADVNAGSVSDPATVAGTPPAGVTPTPATASATAAVPINRQSTLTIAKTGQLAAGAGAGQVGTDIVYAFTVRNTGTTTLTGVAIDDALLAGDVQFGAWPTGTTGTLPPGTSVTATATYTITESDFGRNLVENTATARATSPTGAVTSASDTVVVRTGDQAPGIEVTKEPGIGPLVAGEPLTYSFTVRNTGNVPLTGVTVTDPLLDTPTIVVPGTLAIGASIVVTGDYTVTQTDLDRGYILNTATAAGTSPLNVTVTDSSGEVRTDTGSTPGILLEKADAPPTDAVAGEDIGYAFRIENTGNVTLTGVTVGDPLLGTVTIDPSEWAPNGVGTLSPGQVIEGSGTYEIAQADVDAGTVVNIATTTGSPASGGADVSSTDTVTTPLRVVDEIEVVKSADVEGAGEVGDTVTYTFTAANRGTTTLTGVTVVDPLPGLSQIAYGAWPTATVGLLRPGTSVTATATFELTQAVIDAGRLENVATATGTGPTGATATDTSDTVVLTNAPGGGLIEPEAALDVAKNADPTTGVTVGTLISYTITTTNSGNVTVTGITLEDELPNLSPLTTTWPDAEGTLAPGGTATSIATYRVTQADVDAGSVLNTLTAEGTGAGSPGGIPLIGSGSATSTAAAAGPSISVADAGVLAPGSPGVAGDTVQWTYVVTNDGNVTLTGIAVAETGVTLVPGSLTYGDWPAASGRLEPGQSVTVTARSLLTQAQVDAGAVSSTVTATGTPLRGSPDPVTSQRTATVELARTADMTLVKAGALEEGAIGAVGDRVLYTLEATNTGNVTLYRVDLDDPLRGLVITSLVWPADDDGVVRAGVMPPGKTAYGTGYVILDQPYLDAGSIVNVADVHGYTTPAADPDEVRIDRESNEVVVRTAQAAPQLTTTTTGSRAGSGGLGDTITWTSVVTNTGNVSVTLATAQFTDAHPYDAAPTYTWGPGATPGILAPGQTLTMVGQSTITQTEVDAGAAINAVTATGTSARGGTEVSSNTATATVPTTSTGAAIDLAKSVTAGPGYTGRVGDPVVITYTLTNTGQLTLTGTSVVDTATLTGPIAFDPWVPGVPEGTLRPGDTVTATATHLLTQAEIDAGLFATPATASGTAPAGGAGIVVRDTDTGPFAIAQTADMRVEKTGVLESASGAVGTRILYSFEIENTGTVTLTLVDLIDSLAGVSSPAFEWPDESREGVVLPGQTAVATAVYTITQEDVDAGSVTNVAIASGKPPLGDTIYRESNSEVTTVAPAAPSIALTKTATPDAGVVAGTVISYEITATNDGNQTLSDVTVDDELVGDAPVTAAWPGEPGVLRPGQSAVFRTSYVTTQADADAGSVTNTAEVSATPARGAAVSDSAAVTSTAAEARPAIAVTDAGSLAPGAEGVAGDEVVWTYVVTNAGNVTLTGVDVEESLGILPGSLTYAWPGADGVLAPGQSLTATSRSVLTQADVDAGEITSTVRTEGTAPAGSSPLVPSDTASATVEIPARPGLAALKTGALAPGADGSIGDRVLYTLSATNTGNVTLHGGALEDRLPGLVITGIQWPVEDDGTPVVGLIPPGATVTGQGYVEIRQSDLDRGEILNTAGVYAYTSPTIQDETTIVRDDTNTVRVAMAQAAPQLVSTSAADLEGDGSVGDTITWSHTLRNDGNVSIVVDISDYTDLDGLEESSYSPAGPTVTLAPGGTLVLTGTTTVSQADVDAGAVIHRAQGSGAPVRGDDAIVTSNVSTATVALTSARPSIAVTKAAAAGTGYDGRAGSRVDWTYTLTNDGTVTLRGVGLTDPLADLPAGIVIEWGSLTPGTLPVGATVTARATHALTQAEIDAGRTASTVTAVGTPPIGADVQATATAGWDVTAEPEITVTKDGTAQGAGGVGDEIRYDFVLGNAGNVTLTLVELTDALAGLGTVTIDWPIPASPGVLLPGQTADATAVYTITQDDFDAGSVVNQATVTGRIPAGDLISATSPDVTTTAGAPAPELTVTKTADAVAGITVGQVLEYEVQVVNDGDVTVRGIVPVDLLDGAAPLAATWPGDAGVLAPTEIATFTTTYRVTQADIDAGTVTNTVRVTGAPARGALDPITAAVTSVAAPALPSIGVVDTGALAPGATGVAGDEVVWTYTITNTGTVTLRDIGVADTGVTLIPGSLSFANWPGATGVLAPGESVTATARSVLTQTQVDAGEVTSAAVADGTPAGATTAVTASDDATVLLESRPSLAVVKTGALEPGAAGQVGDRILYTLTATNTGNVTLHRGVLVDPLPGLVITSIDWPVDEGGGDVDGLLPPGSSVTGTGYVELTQADIDRGFLANTARVAAYTDETPQPGETPVAAISNRVEVPTVTAAPQLLSETSGTVDGAGVLGDVITWTHRLTNTGNVSVALAATDYRDTLGLTAPAYDWSGAAAPGTLAPGEYLVLTGTAVVTQPDVDRGSAIRSALGTATPVRGEESVTSNTSTGTVPLAPGTAALTVTDDGALATPEDAVAGGTVVFTYRVTNSGTVTLTGVSVRDALPGIGDPAYTWTTPTGVLAPGAYVDVRAEYTLTQADVDAGSVVSIVTAVGTPPAGADATATDDATVIVDPSPVLAVTKAGEPEIAGQTGVGDWLTFRFTFRNTGNVTLTDVTLSDALAGLTVPTITWPGTAGRLGAGETATATARYQIAQPDVDGGTVRNVATVTGQPPTGPAAVGQSAEVLLTLEDAAPAITVAKGGSLVFGTGDAGSVLRFQFEIRNTGNTTLSAISIDDELPGLSAPVISYPAGGTSLAPGATATATADYTLTQADVDRGYVENVADVDALSARGADPSATSNVFRFATGDARPGITATQTAGFALGGTGVVGDLVDYVFTIRNTGNVTLTDVTWAATRSGLTDVVTTWPAGTPEGSLQPGQALVVSARTAVTQADVDRGEIVNGLTGAGVSPVGAVVDDVAAESVLPLAEALPGIEIVKTGEPRVTDGVQVVHYEFSVRNTGDVTLSDVTVTDELEGLGTVAYGAWPSGETGVLAPGDVVTASADYPVAQADRDRGTVTNSASVSATGPDGAPVADDSGDVVTTLPAAFPGIEITKTMTVQGGGAPRVGSTIVYTFTVVNTGQVTLTGVAIGDEQAGLTTPVIRWPAADGVLAPGRTATATATYTLTQADVDAGELASSARTSGLSPASAVVTDADPGALPLAQRPALSVDKTAIVRTTPTAGQTIDYRIVVRNTGTVTLDDVRIADDLLPGASLVVAWPAADGVLAPGAEAVATGSRDVTDEDVAAGAVVNTATATGTPPSGADVSASDAATVQIPNGAAVSLGISGAVDGGRPGYAGDRVTFTYVITNTGAVALSGIMLTDPRPGLSPIVFGPWPGAAGVLLPGQSVIATATYVLTEADEGTELVENAVVTAVGATPAQVVTDAAAAAIPLPEPPPATPTPVPTGTGTPPTPEPTPVPSPDPGDTGAGVDLPATGATFSVLGILIGVALVMWGATLTRSSSRRKENT